MMLGYELKFLLDDAASLGKDKNLANCLIRLGFCQFTAAKQTFAMTEAPTCYRTVQVLLSQDKSERVRCLGF